MYALRVEIALAPLRVLPVLVTAVNNNVSGLEVRLRRLNALVRGPAMRRAKDEDFRLAKLGAQLIVAACAVDLAVEVDVSDRLFQLVHVWITLVEFPS